MSGGWIQMKKIFAIFLLFLVSVLTGSGLQAVESPQGEIDYPSKHLFPLPEALKNQVRFWIRVYSEFYTNQYIIHDARRVEIIYEVVELGERDDDFYGLPRSRKQRKFLERKRRYYQKLLRQLARRRNFDRLSPEEQRIFELFGRDRNRKTYRLAARNVRIQKGQRDRFLRGLKVSGRYLPYMEEIFREHGLPLELTVLPHVESSFNYRAYSAAGAAGIWQFTRYTGRLFLKINYEVDERLDPILATEAAARLLKHNYEELGSWPLAITAYNHGLYGMKRAKRKLRTDDIGVIVQRYRSRTFGFASRNFYAEFLAALHVVTHARKYFGDVQTDPPLRFREFELPYYVKWSTLSRYLGIDPETLREYNPALRRPVVSGNRFVPKGYRLRLPEHIQAEQLFAQIPPSELYLAQKRSRWYRVRRGDTLSRIARRFGTTVSTLMALNDLRSAHRIRAGEVIRLPEQKHLKSLASLQAPEENPKPAEKTLASRAEPELPVESGADGGEELAAVRPETIPISPPKAKVPVNPATRKAVRNENPKKAFLKLEPTDALVASEVRLLPGTNPPVGYIRVQPEETLGHYAEWLKVPTQRIRNWNGLAYGESIQLGQRLKLVFQNVRPEDFVVARLEYHRGIEEDFFNNYKVIGTITHQIRPGENIWYLSRQVYGLPIWLIQSYNADLNLNELKPGDLIVVPEIASLNGDS